MIRNTLAVVLLLVTTAVSAQFLDTKKDLQPFSGFFNFHYSEKEGNIYLEVPMVKIDQEFLYVHSLRTGLGSNDIGLDRGQLGGQAIVKFVKSGNKLLLLQPNQDYRAITDNELERKSITEAFAKSVLFGFDIKETKGNNYIIDFTGFLMLDAHGVAQRLKSGKEGTYKYDKSRSSVWMERTKSFPKNTEFEALLTFTGQPTGRNLRKVAPNAFSISVIQHHSFVELPDNNYKPRVFMPKSGAIFMSYQDYSAPIWESVKKRYVVRHRLEKKDPNAKISEAKEPIIYYLDPGTPEPVRSALLDGAGWWNQAYEAIGYKDAFQVKMLPADADPMDVRYNVIQWVHRSTRGWSYGGSVVDPRTGEIIKGHVSLGSLRIRQDFMIAQALANQPFKDRVDNHEVMMKMALARIRQLSAHEVGHTIGFAHNFSASAFGRASVMDYPHPTLTLKNGVVDFSNAYATGIGEWDKVTVAYSYSDRNPNLNEKSYLSGIIKKASDRGLYFITDSDARARAGGHSKAHLWDNGSNASEELFNLLKLREVAISNFSEDNFRDFEPYSVLEDVFVPLYFYHRYQTEAAVKSVAGIDYTYASKGDEDTYQVLPRKEQQRALDAVLKTIEPSTLAIPKSQLKLFPPRAFGYGRTRESFKSKMGVAFDALGAAEAASDMTLKLLLYPERANRLIQQKAMDKHNLGLDDLLDQLVGATFSKPKGSAYEQELQRTIQFVTLQHIMNLVASKRTIP
ncbi:MAG: zinc-dependent metalloprotease, partial [Flavobacteriaceae bacterium]|nr:zinc-dependent metalloprotease [Flavobacteriaceae bacterium]